MMVDVVGCSGVRDVFLICYHYLSDVDDCLCPCHEFKEGRSESK